ncbi:RNA-binding riboflavin kinase RibR [Bacillus subtilis]|nr:RNA-binding riboflavin kinase RibR [Bacillus subtilis]ASZ62398.1 RNA-binding riboflavin kinase RibR [Bacillus subtilis]KIN41009.1 Riboflavin kinase [Bacillus subtilis]KIN43063.1 Riboflavin kinase [Bacillus subtilis]MBO3634309.1 RNA-binding riboflavin kinase RibR [Bacillus subtilis]MBO3766487.1 RNA-binding riboflavin kinase RibR [Bacillus subtilis]
MTIIAGTVVKGKQLGRKLGFPTANVDAKMHGLRNGVYGVLATVNHQFHLGVMNIGVKPTVGSNLEKTLEIFLFDFHRDIYGEKIECSILFKIREERRFDSLESLTKQIKKDISCVAKRFELIGIMAPNKKESLLSHQELNLPDLCFYKKCNNLYGVNRGVYNVIDNWFFEYGITQVAYRRIYILSFLSFLKEDNPKVSSKYIRFGAGGLADKLNRFISSYVEESEENILG